MSAVLTSNLNSNANATAGAMNATETTRRRQLQTLFSLHVLNDGFQASLLLLLPLAAAGLGLGAMEIGTITSLHYGLGVVLAVPAAALARRFGGLRVLVAAAVLYSLALLAAPLAFGGWTIAAVFVLAGVGFGVFHPIAFALVGRLARRGAENRSMGWFTASGDVGRAAVTAVVAAALAVLSWSSVSLTLGAAALLLVVLLIVMVRRLEHGVAPPVVAQATPHATASAAKAASKRELLTNRGFLLACGLGFLDALGNSALHVFLPIVLLAKGLSPQTTGLIVSLYFLSSVLGKLVFGPVADRLGERRTLAIVQLTMAGVLIALCFAGSPLLLGVLAAAAGALSKASLPIVLTITAARLPRELNELGFGVNQTVLGAATTISPLVLGLAAMLGGPLMALLLAALLAFTAMLLAASAARS